MINRELHALMVLQDELAWQKEYFPENHNFIDALEVAVKVLEAITNETEDQAFIMPNLELKKEA